MKYVAAWAGWALGLAIAVTITWAVPGDDFYLGLALCLLLPFGFYWAVLDWIEKK